MLLNDARIIEYVERDYLSIRPFSEERVQPASYDIGLGNTFAVLNISHAWRGFPTIIRPWEKQDDLYRWVETDEFVLHPGKFCLASSEEHVSIPPYLAAQVGGKSSLGRLGLIVHATAGFIDPGFEGDVTLELGNVGELPIALRPGMPIAQLVFEELVEPAERPYAGKYQRQAGATESRYHLNFGNTDAS